MKSNVVDIDLQLVHETDKAILVHDGDDSKKAWLAKSMIEWEYKSDKTNVIEVTLPEWLAQEKEFI